MKDVVAKLIQNYKRSDFAGYHQEKQPNSQKAGGECLEIGSDFCSRIQA